MSLLKFLTAFSLGGLLGGGTPAAVAGSDAFVKGEVRIEVDGAPRTFGYRLLRPEVGGADTPLPLVVFLHGAGERGDDNTAQLRHFPERWIAERHLGRRHPAVVLAVQCPANETWSGIDRRDDGTWHVGSPEVAPAMLAVEALVRELSADDSIDRRRIYLTGLSMGGFGSWDLVARHGDWFAAVAPICGGGDLANAERIAAGGTPIWNVHGGADEVVPAELSRRTIAAIRDAGGRVGHTELPGVGHDSWVWAYGPNGVMDWMFAQQRATPAEIPPPIAD